MKHVIGDITTVRQGVIVHQVNCQGVMGSGVAAALRAKYPVIWEKYRDRCRTLSGEGADTTKLLGYAQLVPVGDGLWVCNLFAQNSYGRDGQRFTSYDAFDDGMQHLHQQLQTEHGQVHHPLIGAGLGGGKWEVLKSIIEHRIGETTLWTLS